MLHITVISGVAQLSLWPNSPKPPLLVPNSVKAIEHAKYRNCNELLDKIP